MNTRKLLRKWASPLRERLLPPLRQLALYWRGLTRRERQQVLLMSVVLAGALLWLLFTRPALKTLNHWQQELPRLRSQQAALQSVLADVGGGQINRGAKPSTPGQRLVQSLANAGLSDGRYQLHNEGANWALTFTQPVEAKTLVNWLLNVSTSSAMTLQQVSITRTGNGVTASVTLAVQQKGKGE